MSIYYVLSELVEYALSRSLISEEDVAFSVGRLLELFRLSDFERQKIKKIRPLHLILSDACDYAYERGIIENNSVVCRDLYDTSVMGVFVDRPSSVAKRFYSLYQVSPKAATDYFYALECDSNYIRTDRIKKDLKWKFQSEYGEIDITVNLSKPEKDPRDIAAAKLLFPSGYPKCLLCHENEGYAGNISKPARQNLRQIPFDLEGERWYLQYSPYVYYNEHCIAVFREHTPMKTDGATFRKLLGFVDRFPHYFIGSNADLPIVGGSILSHDHMQGGRYEFAIERAEIDTDIEFCGFSDVKAGIVRWPASVIRLCSQNKERLAVLSDKILTAWRSYTDKDSFIFAETDGVTHNTVTPIARRRGEDYEIDLVLRNNITTNEHPLGVFHPHAEHHNIKKENIGLIELMGLAVLPSRLNDEISDMKKAILEGSDFSGRESIAKHKAWFEHFRSSYAFTEENTAEILKREIGKTFVRVLSDVGVYKNTEEGRRAFLKFVGSV